MHYWARTNPALAQQEEAAQGEGTNAAWRAVPQREPVAHLPREMPDVAVKIVSSSKTIVETFSKLRYEGMEEEEVAGGGQELPVRRWADQSVVAVVVETGRRRMGAFSTFDTTFSSDGGMSGGMLYVLE